MMRTTYGLDVAKRVFHVYWVDMQTGEAFNRRFNRQELIDFFSTRPGAGVALEACGSGHFWARKLKALGHEAILLHPKFIRPFVQTNKTDAADARAIWTAASQPGMRTVAVKSETQQAILALHRMRAQLIRFRTAQVNQLRGLLYEFGVSFKTGRIAGLAEIRQRLPELEQLVPTFLFEALNAQLIRIRTLTEELQEIERRIHAWLKQSEACQAIAAIPGIGLLGATALVATLGETNTFKSGREFAAFLGLVPRQSGTGGRVRLLGISKRGDPYLRSLLTHGARAVLYRAKSRSEWAQALLQRRPANVAVTATANKLARTAWAVLAHGRPYQADHVSVRPT